MRRFFEFFNRLPLVHHLQKPKVRIIIMTLAVIAVTINYFISRSDPSHEYAKLIKFKPFTSVGSNFSYASISNSAEAKARIREIENNLSYCNARQFGESWTDQATYLNCLHLNLLQNFAAYEKIKLINLTDIFHYDINNIQSNNNPATKTNFSIQALQTEIFQQKLKNDSPQNIRLVAHNCYREIENLRIEAYKINNAGFKSLAVKENCTLYLLMQKAIGK